MNPMSTGIAVTSLAVPSAGNACLALLSRNNLDVHFILDHH